MANKTKKQTKGKASKKVTKKPVRKAKPAARKPVSAKRASPKQTRKPASVKRAPQKQTKAPKKRITPRTSLKKPQKAPARTVKAPSPRTRVTASSKKLIPVTARFPAARGKLSERRPPNNPDMPMDYLDDMLESFTSWRNEMEDFSAHLRALDRKRLNGVGVKKLGFIERALQISAENPEFLPHWLSLKKFQADNNYYLALRAVYDVLDQLKEILWNIVLEASDVVYTDALEYYSQVGDAAKRRVDPAETLHKNLSELFKSNGNRPEKEPTVKKLISDAKAIASGKKDGKVEIENVKPHLTGGAHKVVDETFKDTAVIKEIKKEE